VGRRRRALVLLSLALACGGLAASQVRGRLREVEARVGPLVPALVARSDLDAGKRLSRRLLEVRNVPARFVPPDALGAPEEAAGLRLAVPVAAGSYLTTGALAAERDRTRGEAALAPGERAVDVAVAGGDSLRELTGPGARVDVLVTARGRTYLGLQDAELLGMRDGDAGGEASAVATLRVTLRQAVYLTAAQSFAREVRLLVRPPRERRRVRGAEVSGAGL
jgi:pilus assembly protein CpaB